MKHLFLKSLKSLKIDNCGVNRVTQNLISPRRSAARRCYRKYSSTPEKTQYHCGERENEVAVGEMVRASLKIVPLPWLPLSLLLSSHLETHHSPIRSPLPSNSAPCCTQTQEKTVSLASCGLNNGFVTSAQLFEKRGEKTCHLVMKSIKLSVSSPPMNEVLDNKVKDLISSPDCCGLMSSVRCSPSWVYCL